MVEDRKDTQQQHASSTWKSQLFGVARVQVLSVLLLSSFVLAWQDGIIAISFLSGGILVGLNTVLLARSVISSSEVEGDGRGRLYRSAVVRFLLLIAALACASWIGLHLLAIAAGMFMAYVGGYIYVVRLASRDADQSSGL